MAVGENPVESKAVRRNPAMMLITGNERETP